MVKRKNEGDGWGPREPLVYENADWEFYYSSCLGLSEEEFGAMKKAFIEPLPVGVRMNPTFPVSIEKTLQSGETEGTVLPFLKSSMQFESVDRKSVKKSDDLKNLKRLLHASEVIGCITRQEVVSMIPPLALEISDSTRHVLDLCAAPGSKTTQIMEQLADCDAVVIGNDVDWKRANMLAHQTARMCHPGTLITNGDAYYFPISPLGGFDRVLCDVPCSADGTLRKSPEIWKTWRLNDGISLHPRQLQILLRGLNLTKDLLVYSTCSLNPLENEAVVAAALVKTHGEFELVDWTAAHEGLIGKPGLADWPVFDPNSKLRLNREDFKGDLSKSRIKDTMFPCTDESVCAQLHRTRRFLPHLMNTGGFFVAVFRRVGGTPKHKLDDKSTTDFLTDIDADTFATLRDFYGLPEKLKDQLVVPKEAEKRISLVTKELKNILRHTDPSVKVISAGVRAFQAHSSSVIGFRLTQEGARALWKTMEKRVVHVEPEMFMEMLSTREIAPPEKLANCPGWETVGEQYGPMVVVCRNLPVACMAFARNIQVYADKTQVEALLSLLTEIGFAKI